MSTQTPAANNINLPQIIALAQQLGLLDILAHALSGLFSKKPKPPVTVIDPGQPSQPGTPGPIVKPPASSPEPGEVKRIVSFVTARVQMAEKPDMTTPERRHDPGNLYSDVQGMLARKENFNWNSTLWLNATAYDQDGNEWMGHSIIAAGLEYKTRHEVYKDGQLVAFIEGKGGTGDQEPNDGYQVMDSDDIDQIRTRPWIDSAGFNVAMRFHGQGVYTWRVYVDGKLASGSEIHIS
jgi:hypothetical protein